MNNKERYGYRLEDYDLVKSVADSIGALLMIDNNIEGVVRLAKYNKSFLSRKINAAGAARVFLLDTDINKTFNSRIICEYHFEE